MPSTKSQSAAYVPTHPGYSPNRPPRKLKSFKVRTVVVRANGKEEEMTFTTKARDRDVAIERVHQKKTKPLRKSGELKGVLSYSAVPASHAHNKFSTR